MMHLSNRNSILGLLFVALLMMSVGGVFSSEIMMQDGTMQNCPFMGVTSLCTMNILDHLTRWQEMFTSTVSPIAMIILLFLVSLSALARLIEDFLIHKRPVVASLFHSQHRVRVFDSLKLALARGLIHPKIF